MKQTSEVQRIRTAAFLATGDFQFLFFNVTEGGDIPYPNPYRLADLLQDSAIRPILPVGVQKPLPLEPAEGSPQALFIELSRAPKYYKDLLSPLSWDNIGIYSRFAVIDSPKRFEYHIIRKTNLPFLFLHFLGKREDLSIVDSRGEQHGVFPIPSHDAPWQDAFASCPTRECTIVGLSDASGASGFVLMEPKEIGPLSIGAMALGQWGQYVFGSGVTLFFVTVILLIPIKFRLGKPSFATK